MSSTPLPPRRPFLAPELQEPFVRAVIGAVTIPGSPCPLQWDIIEHLARYTLGPTTDIHGLAPMSGPEAAAALTDPKVRRRLVQCVVTLELLEDPIPSALAAQVRDFARALDVHEPMVRAARHAAHGHLALMYADIQRNSYYAEETEHEIFHGDFWRLLRSKFAYSNIVASPRIEAQWATLRDMPAGSLGHAVSEFYRIHHFPLPGARKGIGEIGAQHDFVHVLADYPPTPEGEIDVFSFIATSMSDPKGFVQLVMTLGLFQNSTITHVAGRKVAIARAGTLDEPGAVERFGDALVRGGVCRADVMSLDHFAIAPEPLAVLRDRFGIIPRTDTGQPGALDP